MDQTTREGPGRRPVENTSLFGLVSFRPRLAVVLAVLTVTVAVVAVRIFLDSGLRRADGLTRQAMRLYAAAQAEGVSGTSRDPGEIEKAVYDVAGVRIALPRDEALFSFKGVEREKVGKRTGAAVRLTFEGALYLFVVVRQEAALVARSSSELFSESGFISGEKEGKSFVFWERDGATFLLVSDADLARTFELVRRHLT